MEQINTYNKITGRFANDKHSVIRIEDQQINYGNEEVRVNMLIDLGQSSRIIKKDNFEMTISGLNCKDRQEIEFQEFYSKDPVNHFLESKNVLIYLYSGSKEELFESILEGRIQFLE